MDMRLCPQGDMTSGENYYHGGLLRFDMSEKPAYQVIKELFQKNGTRRQTASQIRVEKPSLKDFMASTGLLLT